MKSGFCLMKRSTADRLVKSMFMITKKKAPNLCARPKKQRHWCIQHQDELTYMQLVQHARPSQPLGGYTTPSSVVEASGGGEGLASQTSMLPVCIYGMAHNSTAQQSDSVAAWSMDYKVTQSEVVIDTVLKECMFTVFWLVQSIDMFTSFHMGN